MSLTCTVAENPTPNVTTAEVLPSELLSAATELQSCLMEVQGTSNPKPDEAERIYGALFRINEMLEGMSYEKRVQYGKPLQEMFLPLVLGSPFAKRSFEKPLGYAADYEMVNMILRNEPAGATPLARDVDTVLLITPPSVAHRNRVRLLGKLLDEAAEKAVSAGRKCRVLNVGCGPAVEIQRFIRDNPLAEQVAFTLIDFNTETLEFAANKIREAAAEAGRNVDVTFRNISVYDIIKKSVKGQELEGGEFDLVYCAGLFDYLKDNVCRRLNQLFWSSCRRGGVVAVTNVAKNCRGWGFLHPVFDWYLIVRSEKEMVALIPDSVPEDKTYLYADETKGNFFLTFNK